jgi:hypothetical protein
MKTVQKGEDLKRVKEDEAEHLVKHKGYKYVPKSTYKGDRVKETAPAKEEDSPETSETKGKGSRKK